MDFSRSPGGFRSRRSYPSLNHISLAPLTPRFPIDDDEDDLSPGAGGDYFSARNPHHDEDKSAFSPRISYLSSYSVPGTPGVLSHSHSRSGSRVRHHQRSKSSGRMNLSDTNLQGQGVAAGQPLHHQQHQHQHQHQRHHVGDDLSKHRNSSSVKQGYPSESTGRRDTEWMLRAGIALASSTREEKGQSWLAKRESSTSLVSEGVYDGNSAAGLHGRSNRRTKSGRSTPLAHSRHGSRAVSRRNSRPDLAMTSLDMGSAVAGGSSHTPIHGASPADEGRHLVPDFVDERIRAEMESIRQEAEEYSTSESDKSWDSEDEMDEQELQRLTRERGFGLGSWIDRMVEWTLFGVEDWPLLSSSDPDPAERPTKHVEITTEEPLTIGDHSGDTLGPGSVDNDDGVSVASEIEVGTVGEKPGELGGWEDAGWLFRTVKRLLI
ncbi:hypothetical protein P170DRAFT_432078 [Aspergillus steynii IBT 23096]|uniref:Uncharacterized protein n=1 Tax=Aspergillus steynii IBT 23096 TaxID=1392250 RepID=A0A2I2GNI4_9EURO|nr:uncharacterized protein P170DRAFT_432078 [Aspergillus steynii IBT 23096]PLB54437.1 hypothetical protein P170DRAFT_432078 [Aspergillus steynii IBT 23096]